MLYNEQIEYSELATLQYDVTTAAHDVFYWDIELTTGKYHQIRAQLANLGCPVVGDALYGSTIDFRPDSIALHAARLVFFHPVSGEEIVAESKPDF